MKQSSRPTAARRGKHQGNALVLIVIIALFAVGAVMFLNATTRDPVGPVQECPWVECDRLTADPTAIHLPQSPQISLDKEIHFTVTLSSNDNQPRGRLEILITPDGQVETVWQAKYKDGELSKEFTATALGNVDAERIYSDDGTGDESELFFLTKGTFLLQAFKHGNARAGGGEAYVVGWLGADGSAHGTLVLASDKKNTTRYAWEKPAS